MQGGDVALQGHAKPVCRCGHGVQPSCAAVPGEYALRVGRGIEVVGAGEPRLVADDVARDLRVDAFGGQASRDTGAHPMAEVEVRSERVRSVRRPVLLRSARRPRTVGQDDFVQNVGCRRLRDNKLTGKRARGRVRSKTFTAGDAARAPDGLLVAPACWDAAQEFAREDRARLGGVDDARSVDCEERRVPAQYLIFQGDAEDLVGHDGVVSPLLVPLEVGDGLARPGGRDRAARRRVARHQHPLERPICGTSPNDDGRRARLDHASREEHGLARVQGGQPSRPGFDDLPVSPVHRHVGEHGRGEGPDETIHRLAGAEPGRISPSESRHFVEQPTIRGWSHAEGEQPGAVQPIADGVEHGFVCGNQRVREEYHVTLTLPVAPRFERRQHAFKQVGAPIGPQFVDLASGTRDHFGGGGQGGAVALHAIAESQDAEAVTLVHVVERAVHRPPDQLDGLPGHRA
jgi:hypothetical protein